jgi:enoyl-CoA hydratase/carnithine racemase
MNRLYLLRSQINKNNCVNKVDQYETIKISDSKLNSKVKIITIDQPQNLNALTDSLISDLNKALIKLNSDPSTKVVIITGSGKAFVSGANIKDFPNFNYQNRILYTSLEQLTEMYYSFKKPLIAAVNGYCFGGGLELALNCDMIFSSDKAAFGFPEIKLGLFPGAAGSQKLVKIFGYLKASEYILSGKNIPLEEAHNKGLINAIYKHEELMSKVEDIADEIGKKGIVSLVAAKQAMKYSLEVGLRQGILAEKFIFDPLFNTEDTKIGVKAFINKKNPEFIDN